MEVIQKIIAHAGLCSRRAAEELIANGQVTVNGRTAKLGDRASEQDRISVKGRPLKTATKQYIIINKPEGYVCTNRHFRGEKNIFDLISIKDKLAVVGRLDKPSRGLVLLTNDGELANRLSHPSFEVIKTYRARPMDQLPYERISGMLKKLKSGVDIGEVGMLAFAKSATFEQGYFEIGLTQGIKRQIRRMLSSMRCEIVDLERTSIGPLKLGNLGPGQWRPLSAKEIEALKRLQNED